VYCTKTHINLNVGIQFQRTVKLLTTDTWTSFRGHVGCR